MNGRDITNGHARDIGNIGHTRDIGNIGHTRDIGNIGHTRHKTMTNKTTTKNTK
jgi:hypothetical protein